MLLRSQNSKIKNGAALNIQGKNFRFVYKMHLILKTFLYKFVSTGAYAPLILSFTNSVAVNLDYISSLCIEVLAA